MSPTDWATLFVNYAACQISDKNAFGVMLHNDARAGYVGNYVSQYKDDEDDVNH